MAKKVYKTVIEKAKAVATNKSTWHDVKAGSFGGIIQGLCVHLMKPTFGTLASAFGVSMLPTQKGPKFLRVSKEDKKVLIINQTHDAVLNLLIGESN